MKRLPLLLLLISLSSQAGQCPQAAGKPCILAEEYRLPSGKTYRLRLVEAPLELNGATNNSTSGYWGMLAKPPATFTAELSLSVNGQETSIPAKIFNDLGNVSSAEVKENEHALVLIIRGGEGAGAYYATFVLVDGKVRKRTVRSSEKPEQLWEKTAFRNPGD